MVLSIMRRHAKSWLIKFLIGIIALVFIFYFGYSFNRGRVMKMAAVNGEVITGTEYQKLYQDMLASVRQQYKELLNDNLLKIMDLKNRALETLIVQKLISQEARRLGLEVTEEEVQQAIMRYPAFQINGRFDMRRYQALLANNRMNPEDFEESMAANILQEKLRQLLFVFMEATDQEVLDRYTFYNEKLNLDFVRFDQQAYESSVKVDPAAMRSFFDGHREQYRIPEKIKVAYVEIDPATLKDKVKIDENDIRVYYDYNRDTFSTPKEVRARHILFLLDQNAGEEKEQKVRKKAREVLEKARKGEDFSELAKTYSEGPTKDKGGDLGYFAEGTMVKPFQDAAFSLKKGEISDLVRTPFGYHIIKVEDIREAGTKTFDEVKDEIAAKLTMDACMDLAHEKGLSLMDQMPYDVDLAQFAAENGLKAETTDYVSQQETIPGIGGDQRFRDSLFALEVKETSDLIELGGKFYIFQVLDKKESYLPEMAEVADRVEADFKSSLAKGKAKAAAEKCLADARAGKDWEELAKEHKLKIDETGFFTRRGSVPKIGNIPGLTDAAFRLGESNPYPETVFEDDTGAFVVRWKAHQDIDKDQYKAARSAFRYSLVVEKQRRAFENWVDALRKKAEIEILTPVS